MIPERAAAVVIRSDRRVAESAFTAFYVKEAHENCIDDMVDDQPDVINSLLPLHRWDPFWQYKQEVRVPSSSPPHSRKELGGADADPVVKESRRPSLYHFETLRRSKNHIALNPSLPQAPAPAVAESLVQWPPTVQMTGYLEKEGRLGHDTQLEASVLVPRLQCFKPPWIASEAIIQ